MPTSCKKRNEGRMYEGQPPADGVHVANLVLGAETWFLFVRNPSNMGSWIELKLCAQRAVPSKANYWFSWSAKGQRLARHPDVALMRDNRPALHALLNDVLSTVAREHGDVRLLPEDVLPLYFEGDPLAPIGVEGGQGPTPGEPESPRALDPLLSEGVKAKGSSAQDITSNTGDPDEDLL